MSSATPSAAALRTPAPKQKKTRRRNRLDDEPRYYANTMGGGSGVANVQSRGSRKINDYGRRQRKAKKARRAQGNMNVRRNAAAAAQQQSLGGRSVQRPGTAGLGTSTISQRSQSIRGKRHRQALLKTGVEGSARVERDGDVIMERDKHAGAHSTPSANPRKRRTPRHTIAGAASAVATSTPRMAAAANPTIAGPGTVAPATPRATRASASTTTALPRDEQDQVYGPARTPTPVPTDTGPIAVLEMKWISKHTILCSKLLRHKLQTTWITILARYF